MFKFWEANASTPGDEYNGGGEGGNLVGFCGTNNSGIHYHSSHM